MTVLNKDISNYISNQWITSIDFTFQYHFHLNVFLFTTFTCGTLLQQEDKQAKEYVNN
jgi:hypothetical protein